MSQLAAIETAQRSMEECFTRRMAELEAQLHSGAPGKETVARVAEEFRAFRELMFSMLGLLRQQINECSRMVDNLETRHRRKALLFMGVPEREKEDCTAAITTVVSSTMKLDAVSAASIITCHRIGAPRKDHHRPILVRFSNVGARASVWRAKAKLKGSSTSVREFLTKPRQAVFSGARQHFGIRACWTQDGVIVVKPADGTRHKLTSFDDLETLTSRYPRASDVTAAAAGNSAERGGSAGATLASSKSRRY